MTIFTNDVHPDLAAILDRLATVDGIHSDCAIVTWEHCQLLARSVRQLLEALSDIEQTGHNAAFLMPDLCGHPDRYELLADRLAAMALEALNRIRWPNRPGFQDSSPENHA